MKTLVVGDIHGCYAEFQELLAAAGIERVFGLDTSCVHGKRLTGITLPDFNIFSVQSRGDLWNQMRRQYRQSHPAVRTGRPKAMKVYEPVPLDEESERLLHAIVELAFQENARVVAWLHEQPGYDDLTPRQQAKTYAEQIGDPPLSMFLHMARKGELDFARARRAVKGPQHVAILAKQAGLRTENL